MSFKTKVMMLALAGLATAGVVSVAAVPRTETFDAAHKYNATCKGCHGAKAEKKFNASLSDDELVQAILKGKKAEKPPNMPGYEAKGITADNAKALVDYMKSVKQ